MKMPVLFLALLSIVSANANEYKVTQITCTLTARSSTISGSGQMYPGSATAFYRVTSIAGKKRIVRIEANDPHQLVDQVKIRKLLVEPGFDGVVLRWVAKLNSLSKKKLASILNLSNDAPELAILNVGKKTLKEQVQGYGKSTVTDQFHFPPSQHDGLSVHVTRECTFETVLN